MDLSSKLLLVCPWTLINSLSPEHHCQGLTLIAGRTLCLGCFLNLAYANFIWCQQFLPLDKWAVIPHLPPLWSGLILQTLIVGCLFSRLRNPRLFFFPQIPHIHSSLFLKHRSHPTSSCITLVLQRRRKFGVCVCKGILKNHFVFSLS